MSKFLKFIVHFIVICTIICVVGLAVPPFLGITTEILDDSSKETNLPMGSVTYAIPVKTEEAAVGDSILYQGDSKAYKYMITEIDQENKTFQVIDASNSKEKALTVQTATSEAHELLKKEIAAATADEPEAQQEEPEKEVVISPTENIVTHLKEALEEEKQKPEAPVDEEEETESLPIRRMAIPVWSAAQIAESAKNQGDAPDIVKDDITKVTLFDYSDIVAGDKPASAEKQN